jgi:hypothetical protein
MWVVVVGSTGPHAAASVSLSAVGKPAALAGGELVDALL